MRTRQLTWNVVRLAWVAALGVSLTSCGGGGDGGNGPQYIDLTAANRDTVGHATAAGILAVSPTGLIPLTSSPAAAGRTWAQAVGQALRQPLGAEGATTRNGRERALALIGPVVQACMLGGTMSLSVDDRDNNGAPSVGDVLTIVYSNCRDTASETLNGTVAATYTQLVSSPVPLVSARLNMTQLSDVTPKHSLTLDGVVLFDYSQPTSSTEHINMTSSGQVVAAVTTHLFTDTVTLQNGFVVAESYDASVAPPPGSTVPGRTASTASGSLASAKAGGIVDVSIAAGTAMTKYSADDYPYSGVAQVKGRKGTLLLTALSANSVRLDLDDNDDGVFESTYTDRWDWLL